MSEKKPETPGLEHRTLSQPVELRSGDSGKTIGGHAAVFNEETNIAGFFREVIAPGAFTDTLKTSDVRAFFDHDSGRVLGRTSAGTLSLKQDKTGLAAEIALPDTGDGRDVATLIERGDVDGMSFGFSVRSEEWSDVDSALPLRTITDVELFEVSVVSQPAYDGTSIALRSLASIRKEERKKNFNAAQLRMRMNLDRRDRENGAKPIPKKPKVQET